MEENEEKEEGQKKFNRKLKGILLEIWSWIYSIIIAVVLVLFIKGFLFSTTIVKGISMNPTLTGDAQMGGNDILIIDRLSQVRDIPLERGDIVVIEAPLGPGEGGRAYYEEPKDGFEKIKKFFVKTMYVKRVIGLPGEHMKIENDAIYINGERLNEPYVNPDNSSNRGEREIVVPQGYVFCMGDNRGSSSDSRVFGSIPVEKVEGRIALRIYPLNKMGKVK